MTASDDALRRVDEILEGCVARLRHPIAAAIFDALVRKQTERDFNPNWMRDELDAYFDVVNRERAKLGKPPVAFDEIVKAERSARGHVDYLTKCAHYGRELVERKDGGTDRG